MQSFSPQIIKHYIPLQFSKQVIDYQPSPIKVFTPSEDNPLTNIVLRNVDKSQSRDFILTFTNKTHTQYKPKKQLTYRNLFQQLQGGQQKMQLIKRQLINYQEKQAYVKSRTNKIYQETLSTKNRYPISTQQIKSHNKIITQYRRSITSAKSYKFLQPKGINSRAYSSMNFRELKKAVRDSQLLNSRTARTKIGNERFIQSASVKDISGLKIRGSKAPEAQMTDHWKRNTETSALFIRSSR